MNQEFRGKQLSLELAKCFTFIGCMAVAGASHAETAGSADLLEQYKQLLSDLQKEVQVQRKIIAEQGKELAQLKTRLDSLPGQPNGSPQASQTPPQPNQPNQPNQPSQPGRSSQPGQSSATAANKSGQEKLSYQLLSEPIDRPSGAQNGANHSQSAAANANDPANIPSGPVGEAPPQSKERARPPEMPRLSDTVGGVLTRKGRLVVEPSLEYAYTSNNRVFLDAFTFLPSVAIGLIDLRQVKRHTFIGSLGARYGMTDRLELEVRIPYVYRSDEQRSRPVSIGAGADETFNATGHNIGDVELTGRYQMTSGAGGWPILVGNLVATIPTGKSPFSIPLVQAQGVPGATFPTELPTGTGYYSFQPSITALYPSDPAVFFGNLLYTYNASTNENVGRVSPGDGIGLTFGMGFGINERSSFNLGYSHRHIFNSKINGQTIKGSKLDIGQLLMGFAFKYSKQTSFNLSLGVGTTEDAQDVRLNFRVPMIF